jgi:hypothetical protein
MSVLYSEGCVLMYALPQGISMQPGLLYWTVRTCVQLHRLRHTYSARYCPGVVCTLCKVQSLEVCIVLPWIALCAVAEDIQQPMTLC